MADLIAMAKKDCGKGMDMLLKDHLLKDHPLIGTWVTEDEDSDAAFVISAADEGFRVSGFSRSSATPFEISDIVWDGEALSFTARFPPADTVTRNVFRARSHAIADLELTTYEVWIKKEVKPGELPAGWQTEAGQ